MKLSDKVLVSENEIKARVREMAAGRYAADMVRGGAAGGRAQIQKGQGIQTTLSA